MLDVIYRALKSDDLISAVVGDRIKFYKFPQPETLAQPCIIIDPLDVDKPCDFASNKWTARDYLYQIDVWSQDHTKTKEVSQRVEYMMWGLNFAQIGGIDEHDEDFNIYRDARRYRGKVEVV
ncbi:DUF3168 domain-containing protein [Bacillus sp. FSL W7-1360]